MLRFMTASFLLLGWTLYEASGGADYTPPAAVATPVIAASRDDVAAEGATEFTALEARAYVAPAIPDPMPVEIVSRGRTDLGPVAPLPASADTVAPQTTKAVYAVTGAGVNMRSGPGTSHEVIATLPLGAKAEVIESDGNWNHIRLEDGTDGWMSANYLAAV